MLQSKSKIYTASNLKNGRLNWPSYIAYPPSQYNALVVHRDPFNQKQFEVLDNLLSGLVYTRSDTKAEIYELSSNALRKVFQKLSSNAIEHKISQGVFSPKDTVITLDLSA